MVNQETNEEVEERILSLNGAIAEESWFDDDVTPQLFKDELDAGSGNITVWINSPGGDCVAAAQIYNMLVGYKGNVKVKIDGIAASAASVIAMAGDQVLMSPVSMMMIHNPATLAFGDHIDMAKAIDMLEGVKNSIINAYAIKTGMTRAKLSRLMDEETWMDANKAIELGFADDIIRKDNLTDNKENSNEDHTQDKNEQTTQAVLFSSRAINNALINKLEEHYKQEPEKIGKDITIPKNELNKVYSANDLRKRLDIIKKYI